MSEAAEQAAYFQWAAYIPAMRWAFHIPNGGSRNKIEAANLKRQGVKAGVSDIFLPLPRGGYHGLFIEMKVGRNKPTEKQREFIAFAKNEGYAAVVCYSAEEAIVVTKKYLKGDLKCRKSQKQISTANIPSVPIGNS